MDFSPNRIPLDLMLAYHHWPHSTCQHILGRIPLRSDPCVSIDPYPVPSALCRLQLQLSIDQLTQLVYASMSWPYPANSFGSWIVCEYACIYIYIYILCIIPLARKRFQISSFPKCFIGTSTDLALHPPPLCLSKRHHRTAGSSIFLRVRARLHFCPPRGHTCTYAS